jgi:hypothetical protein
MDPTCPPDGEIKTSTCYPELPTIRENKPVTSTVNTIGFVKMRSEQAMRPKSLRAS